VFHRTNRLLLRPIWGEDAPALHRAIADENVVRNLARAPWPYGEADARAFAARPVDPLFPRLLVTLARDAQVIGCIGLEPAEVGAELGYWIARPHWGQGYASEAGQAMVAIAAMLGHTMLGAWHFLDNPASGKVLRKLGFEPSGRIEERFSCARKGKAPAAQYHRSLATQAGVHQRAA